ncbi:hypothetical protein BBJ28_00000501 [Nothophytophthora sp. Chile5]|nr:hypothetical protein BBJ28_00000501 [Nothophytophthora sp. Chile5]
MSTGGGQQHGARQREARAPPAPSAAPSSGGKAPRFGYLLKLGLESAGVRYISMDLLRKAKKGHTSEREYWALWRLLHDVVLVVLADFDVDVREMERLNSPERLESALLDPELHCQCRLQEVLWRFWELTDRIAVSLLAIQMELVRFYLYEWGFVGKSLPLEAQIHQLHSAFGRLQSHLNELQAYTRYHERLVRRLEEVQNVPEEHRDELLPAYVLHLLAGPRTRLIAQVRLLEQRYVRSVYWWVVYIYSILTIHDVQTALLDSVQMLEDEALFYKWINGLVLSLNQDGGTSNAQMESLAASSSVAYTALYAQIQDVQALFQANASSFQQIVHGYEEERKKWKARQKSRSRLQQLDTKVERFTHEVQTRELFDPQKLFLRPERSWAILRSQDGVKAAQVVDRKPHLPTIDEVERLQKQLENVLGEITREYCGVHLR